mgnify:CR=1 FL=1
MMCVTAGTIDLATCGGIKVAKDLDPTGVRTIGVLTKVDVLADNQIKDKLVKMMSCVDGTDITFHYGYRSIIN